MEILDKICSATVVIATVTSSGALAKTIATVLVYALVIVALTSAVKYFDAESDGPPVIVATMLIVAIIFYCVVSEIGYCDTFWAAFITIALPLIALLILGMIHRSKP